MTTLYYYISESATAPDKVELMTGRGATKYGSSDDVQSPETFAVTGLVASTTYYTYFIQKDGYWESDILESGSWTTASSASAAITGTATAAIDEDDVVTGGKTIIITLTGDTFKAAGTGPIGSIADTNALLAGITSAQSELTGWNNEVRDNLTTTDIVRTSDTVATVTLPGSPSYDITAQETITVTVPTDVLVTAAGAIVATPTFTVDVVGGGGGGGKKHLLLLGVG